jgi:transposase-like protein
MTEAQQGAAVALFEQGSGYTATATHLGLSPWVVRNLHRRWVLHGRKALVARQSRASYTFEFKLDVVRKAQEGASYQQLAEDFGLPSGRTVQGWVQRYNRLGEDGLEPKPKGRQPKEPGAPPDAPAEELTDLQRLEQENLRLRAENAYLKKLRALRAQRRR